MLWKRYTILLKSTFIFMEKFHATYSLLYKEAAIFNVLNS